MKKLINYIRESRAELSKVVWPSRTQIRNHTIMVIIVSVVIAIFLGAVDFAIEQLIIKPFIGG